ncbi:WD40 repeat domain-containing serine/threonine-protein kinase [Anabaenopsis sp. FSS-46]|uniref:WD40 repeat domain-containing serine/threonine-protein kinase n=1 Tax=Anabaenopsis sp. FSS-46 TaxID=2971766 RepID=UPI002474AFAE|nr:WD40 repeat domain-containing serine/threonine-protein kinase [Anabaenopsis sp. FSS-46]MDH6098182.1 WD40 repeat domain-containing serine/threonine-protein kinase [Anabaenopsis sp. FSS-46]
MSNQIYCLNPDCLHPNHDNFQYCQKCGSKLVLTDRYIPRSILGQGGFGRTFLATDQYKPSQPYCVIKQFLPQAQGTDTIEKASQLFAQEAQRLEELGKHPQIPGLMAYFIVNGHQYLVQEFVAGNTLQNELDQNGVFSEQQIRELLPELLQILEYVHSKQVIHRDIKPENIIRRTSDNKLFLVDFGAAKVVKPQQRTATGTIIGSAEYCAPEQSMGKPLFSSDLYSLGVTCLHLLTGVSPFDLYSPLEGEWVWRDYLNGNVVSDELGEMLEKLAHPIPKRRYQSVSEVIQALSPVSPVVTPSSTELSPAIDTSKLRHTLSGHSKPVCSVGFSPDSQTLASGSNDKTIKLWDVRTGKVRRTLTGFFTGHSDSVYSVGFSPDGQTLASGSGDKTIKLWDVTTGKVRHTLTGHSDSVCSVGFSPDGQTLASGSRDKTIKRWDVNTGKVRHTLTGHSNWVNSVVSPDGQTLASGSDDNTIKLWDVKTRKLRHTLTGHSKWVRSVGFSPDGQTLASGSDDETIKLWDVTTGKLRHTLTGHYHWVSSVGFSPDGQTLASGSYDRTIKLWDVRTGNLRHTLTGHYHWVSSVGFSPDGQTLASGSNDNTIKLWRLR